MFFSIVSEDDCESMDVMKINLKWTRMFFFFFLPFKVNDLIRL